MNLIQYNNMDHLKIIELVSEIEVYEKHGRLDLAAEPYKSLLSEPISDDTYEEKTIQWLKQSDKGVSMFLLGKTHFDNMFTVDSLDRRNIFFYVNGWEKHSNSKCGMILIETNGHFRLADGTFPDFWREKRDIIDQLLEKKEPKYIRRAKIYRGGKYGVFNMNEISNMDYICEKICAYYQHLHQNKHPEKINILIESLCKFLHTYGKYDINTWLLIEKLMRITRQKRDIETFMKIITFVFNDIGKDYLIFGGRFWANFDDEKGIKKWFNTPARHVTLDILEI